jgi:hypothetical protein
MTEKTAQTTANPNTDAYLKRAVNTAVANASSKVGAIKSTFSTGVYMTGDQYVVQVSFTPEISAPQKEAIQSAFYTNIAASGKTQQPPVDPSKVVFKFATTGKTAMDTKDVLLKLLKIAQQHQTALEKLAQTNAVVSPAAQSSIPAANVATSDVARLQKAFNDAGIKNAVVLAVDGPKVTVQVSAVDYPVGYNIEERLKQIAVKVLGRPDVVIQLVRR